MDEKRLDGLEALAKDAITHVTVQRDTILELIRLARLGLWAEKHGVPALLAMRTDARHSAYITVELRKTIEAAFELMPKTY